MGLGDWIFRDGSKNVIMELLDIYDYNTAHNGINEISSVDRRREMFGAKYGVSDYEDLPQCSCYPPL
jgi:hypothetical protein